MKTGQTTSQLIATINAQAQAKQDYLADTRRLQFSPDGNLVLRTSPDDAKVFSPTRHCLGQMAERCGIPVRYVDRMAAEAPELLARNFNHWFSEKPEVRMLRAIEPAGAEVGTARAFVSRKYRRLDYVDMADMVLPVLDEMGCEIKSAEVTETRLYIQAVCPQWTETLNQVLHAGSVPSIRRALNAGIAIGNSEVGMGSLWADQLVFDQVCTNGLVVSKAVRKSHVGRGLELGGDGMDDGVRALFSDRTIELDDRAFWAKFKDVVRGTLSEQVFRQTVEAMRSANAEGVLGEPEDVVALAQKRFTLSEDEAKGVRKHLLAGGDFSRYGLLQAVTRQSQDVESYDRAYELERLGGQILALPKRDLRVN